MKYVYWDDDGAWIGYLLDHPNHWTQGDDLEDLKEHLRDIYQEVAAGNLPDPPDNHPGILRVGELVV